MRQIIQKRTLILVVALCIIAGGAISCSGKKQENIGEITALTVNYEENPLGIERTPLFGWQMISDVEGQQQTACRIVVSETEEKLEKQEYVWDSGRMETGVSVAIQYAGEVLQPETCYVWKVYVWDKDGNCIESNEKATFETGVADGGWEGASWIGVRKSQESKSGRWLDINDYQIEYDVKLERTTSGFVWGMDTNQYGRYMKCCINTRGDNIEFYIAECLGTEENTGDKILLNEEFSEIFGSMEDFYNAVHHVELDIDGITVTASIDGVQVWNKSYTENGMELGNIGLWTTRGAFYAYYDNIIITDSENNVICNETFDNENAHIFSPYYAKIVDGWCEADSGFMLMQDVEEPAPILQRSFGKTSDSDIISARLYATALGNYRIFLNENDICGEYLTPGRSIYTKEVYYRTYDVTEFINDSSDVENVICAVLGHGNYNKSNNNWGEDLAFQAKLVIQYEDDTRQVIVTDENWQVNDDGPIRNDDMYQGEYYDAEKEVIQEDKWRAVDIFTEYDTLYKIAAETPAVKSIETLSPLSVSEPVQGQYVYDFGQNFNGNCQITLKNTNGKKGQVVIIRYAEAINSEKLSGCDDAYGTIYTENLYTADNTDYYVIGGYGEETYMPSLVCRGFRYVQISGIDEAIPIEDINGIVLSTDNRRTGTFSCSDEKVNRLYESIYWTQISNYLDVPTDCPQRDERFGWTGDAQVFANTAAYNADVHNYLQRYVEMIISGQSEYGAFPDIAPSADGASNANGWSDAGIILVWELYQQYGDTAIIKKNLDAMCNYVDYLVDTSDDFIRSHSGYGDHNAMSTPDDDIIDTAQCAYVAKLLAKMSEDIGEDDIAAKYTTVYEQYKKAWQEHYINEDGSIDCWLQSIYALGLAFGLYPEELEAQGAACLNAAVAANDYHLNTGYIGTQFVLPMLCKYGYVDAAYRILQQDTYPSWNNILSHDQTTLTEAWFTCYDIDDGTYEIRGSLNHYALGTVGQWLYSDVLGIKRDESNPGFKHFYICPMVGGGLTYASGSYESVYGRIESSWEFTGNEVVFRFSIPANTTATVSLPDVQYQNMELGAGNYEYHVEVLP
ncbi:MAG: glycoside hydrolase family 78 protein [Clostridiales bacterium]|nr:glycoside hydrolase family 78 protein [Clostridiales bacterium]